MDDVDNLIHEDIPEWKDEEFEAMSKEFPSNVEDILHEDENLEADLENDLFTLQPLDAISISSAETSSLASTSRHSTLTPRHNIHRLPTFLLKFGILKTVSQQINNAKNKLDVGQASCIAIGRWLAVGTNRGLVFLFDFHQKLLDCLGNLEQTRIYGGVSALTFNRNGDRLLVGFARGHIDMWDITTLLSKSTKDSLSSSSSPKLSKCKLLRSMDEVHTIDCAVLFLRFTDDPTTALCGDSGGSLFQLHFKRGLSGRSCESACLFSGSRGEICCMEPLLLPPNITEHEISQFRLVAIASFTQIIVIGLSPKLTVHFKYPLKGDAAVFPLLAWQFLSLETNRAATWKRDPVLAFARDQCVYLLRAQLITNVPQFQIIQTINLDYSLINMKWLGDFTLCLIDKMELLHVLDVPSESELDFYELSRVKLSYNSSLFKSLATGGNVSPALAYAGERACQHSVVVYEGQLLLLGQNHLHLYILRNWLERVNCLIRYGWHEVALKLLEEYYLGTSKTFPGLQGLTVEQRRQRVESEVSACVDACLHNSDATISPSFVYSLCRIAAIMTQQEELLRKIFEKFNNSNSQTLLLDTLSKFLLNTSTGSSSTTSTTTTQSGENFSLRFLPPALMQSLIEYLVERQRLHEVRHWIGTVDITCVDLDLVSKLCWIHGIYDAIIHIYTCAMLDYKTPLEKMTQTLQQHQEKKINLSLENYEKLGNQLLLYTTCCLRGESYNSIDNSPAGASDAVDMQTTIQDIAFNHLITRQSENMIPYLLFNINEFLNMNLLVLEEPYFQLPFVPEASKSRKELLIERIMQCMLTKTKQQEENGGLNFSCEDIGRLCVFLSRQLKENTCDVGLVQVILTHVESMFEHVCSTTVAAAAPSKGQNYGNGGGENYLSLRQQADQNELQQSLVDILEFVNEHCQLSSDANVAFYDGLFDHRIRVDLHHLMNLVAQTPFFQVKEFMLRQRHDYGPIVHCYLDDPSRKHLIFNFIDWLFNDDATMELSCRQAVRDVCLTVVHRLVKVSAEQTLLMMCNTMNESVSTLLRIMDQYVQPDSEEVYLLLQAAYTLSVNDNAFDGGGIGVGSGGGVANQDESNSNLIDKCLSDSILMERFLHLTCIHAPRDVLGHLKQFPFYQPDRALQLMRSMHAYKEAAYLLEKMNKIEEAAQIYLNCFNAAWNKLMGSSSGGGGEGGANEPMTDNDLGDVERNVVSYTRLCLRYASEWPKERQEKIWFPLLNSVLEKQQSTCNRPVLTTLIKSVFQTLLSAMNQHFGLATLLGKILKDPAYSHDNLNELRNLVLDMLETFHYESTLLQTCQRLRMHDLSLSYATFVRHVSQGMAPKKYRCALCDLSFKGRAGVHLSMSLSRHNSLSEQQQQQQQQQSTATDSTTTTNSTSQRGIVVFRCGHAFHSDCLLNSFCFSYCGTKQIWLCATCEPTINEQQQQTTRQQRSNGFGGSGGGGGDLMSVMNRQSMQINRLAHRDMSKPILNRNVHQELSRSRRRQDLVSPSIRTSSQAALSLAPTKAFY